jgi:hypothetical protein
MRAKADVRRVLELMGSRPKPSSPQPTELYAIAVILTPCAILLLSTAGAIS